MDDIIEEQGQELYNKLNSEYLIECGEKKIDEWNDLYLEYLESEWNRLYPKRDWDLKNVFELVKRDFQLKRPDFHGEDFRDAISRGVRFARAHLEGANFLGAHLDGADFSEVHLEKADCSEILFDVAHMKGEKFIKAHMVGADLLMAHLEGAIFMETHLEGATFEYAIMDGKTMFIENSIDKKTNFMGTALSAIRIDPNMRTKLERNILEIQWRKWYDKPKISPGGFLKKKLRQKRGD